MRPHPSFDPELLIIIAISTIAILGLAWIFLTNHPSELALTPTLEPTGTSADVTPLRTQVVSRTPSATSTLEERSPTATETSPASYPGPPAETLPAEGTPTIEILPALSTTPEPDQAEPLSPRKYDDTDPNIAYDRFWTFEMNSGTKFAYKGTLHISNSIGNEVSFRFTGQRFNLGYQRGKNFGTVTVLIDDQPYSFHEQAFGNIWRSPQLSPGVHSVRLIHENGESVNLDYIEILD
jgi:hypothetical protein